MEPAGGTILMELIFVVGKHRGRKINIARFPLTRNLRGRITRGVLVLPTRDLDFCISIQIVDFFYINRRNVTSREADIQTQASIAHEFAVVNVSSRR